MTQFPPICDICNPVPCIDVCTICKSPTYINLITAPSPPRVDTSTPIIPGEERMRERMAFHSEGLVKGTATGIEWETASESTCWTLDLSDLYLSIMRAWKRNAASAA